jgi:hypothetical protein
MIKRDSTLPLPSALLAEVKAAASSVGCTLPDFVQQVIEADLASRRLKTLKPNPNGYAPQLPGMRDADADGYTLAEHKVWLSSSHRIFR